MSASGPVRLRARPLLVVADHKLTAGVDFPVATHLEDVGYKALAVSFSELAAMGAHPVRARLHVEGPVDGLDTLLTGVNDAARDAGVPINTADDTLGVSCSLAEPLSLSVQATGEVPPNLAVGRGGARAGDAVFVSGALGEAAAGLRAALHGLELPEGDRTTCAARLNRPQPRVALGRALAGIATAAIDISSGLVADLDRLLAASDLTATVTLDSLPLGSALASLPRSEALALALGGEDRGEADYELCFCVSLRHRPLLAAIARRTSIDLTEIGTTGPPAAPGADGTGRRSGRVTLLDAAGSAPAALHSSA